MEYQVKCLGNTFGLTPSVRIVQPLVASAYQLEKITWMPWLQRWDPDQRTSNHILRSANWITFYATNQAYNYYYTNQPKTFVFENLTSGYYYRVIHVVQWSSTSELGSMPSDYRTTSGYCRL